MKVKSKVWIEKNGELVFGIGKASILEYVLKTGSIAKAAKKLGMSYRHAWSYIKSAERRLGRSLVVCTRGGRCGGGAVLTEYAKDLLQKFIELEQEVTLFTDKRYRKVFG